MATSDSTTKRCSKCGQEFPATTEFFYAHPTGTFKLSPKCKPCTRESVRENSAKNPEEKRERDRQYYWNNREKVSEYHRQYYTENRSEILEKQRQEYAKNPERKLATNRRWRKANPERYRSIRRASNHAWKKANPDKIQQYNREYRKANRESIRKQSRQYRLANREKVQESHRQYIASNRNKWREYDKQYRLANLDRRRQTGRESYRRNQATALIRVRKYEALNRDKVRKWRQVVSHNRRARVKNLPHDFTTEDRDRMMDYWNHCCCVCGRPAGLWHTIAIEHWVAIADLRPDNPGTVATNLVPMCHSIKDGQGGCNNSKQSKDAVEWLTELFGKTKAQQITKRVLNYFKWVKEQV